jgi:hypothetical protein
MDRITTEKRDGSNELAGSCEAISPGPPGPNRVIPFPVAAAASAGDQEGAGVSSASASSFVQVGVPALAVVMRIKQGLPKISMPPRPREERPAPAADQSAGERD